MFGFQPFIFGRANTTKLLDVPFLCLCYILGFVQGYVLLSAMGFIPIKAPFGGNISGAFSTHPTSKSEVSLRGGLWCILQQTKNPHNLTLLSMGSMEPFSVGIYRK